MSNEETFNHFTRMLELRGFTEEKPVGEVYAFIYDLNTTADRVDDETFVYTDIYTNEAWQTVTQSKLSITYVSKSDNEYLVSGVTPLEREGYWFAGWQTRPVVTEADLVNGVSPYLVLFGTQSRFGMEDTVMRLADMESCNGDTVTLYAR